MSENSKNVLQHVHPARREFLQRLLAGAAFAAPVIATFSIDGLTADSAYAGPTNHGPNTVPNVTPGNQTCSADAGYQGPYQFHSHVSVHGLRPGRRVNGEVQILLNIVNSGIQDVTQMTGNIVLVTGATLVSAFLLVDGDVAVHLVLSGGNFNITDSNLNLKVACDLDELADFMASGQASMLVNCTLGGMSYSLSGPIVGDSTVPLLV